MHSESFWYDVNLRSCHLLQVKQLCPANARPHTTHSQTRPLGGHGPWHVGIECWLDGMWCGIFLDHAMQVQRMPENGYPDTLPHTNIQSRSFWRFFLLWNYSWESAGHGPSENVWRMILKFAIDSQSNSLTTTLTVNLIFWGRGMLSDLFSFTCIDIIHQQLHLFCLDSSGKRTYR